MRGRHTAHLIEGLPGRDAAVDICARHGAAHPGAHPGHTCIHESPSWANRSLQHRASTHMMTSLNRVWNSVVLRLRGIPSSQTLATMTLLYVCVTISTTRIVVGDISPRCEIIHGTRRGTRLRCPLRACLAATLVMCLYLVSFTFW